MLDEEAGVLDDEEAGGVCLGGSFGVRNSQLEPKRFGMDGDGGIGDGGDVFRAAEDVDNVDWKWDVFEAGVGVFAQDFGLVGIDWDDFVADPLEVGGDFVGGPARVGGKADDGDGFGGAEEIDDVVGRWRGIIANLNEQVDWMSLDGKRVNGKVTSGEWQAEKRNSKLPGVSRIEREDSASSHDITIENHGPKNRCMRRCRYKPVLDSSQQAEECNYPASPQKTVKPAVSPAGLASGRFASALAFNALARSGTLKTLLTDGVQSRTRSRAVAFLTFSGPIAEQANSRRLHVVGSL